MLFFFWGKFQGSKTGWRLVLFMCHHPEKRPQRPNDTCSWLQVWLAVVSWHNTKQHARTCQLPLITSGWKSWQWLQSWKQTKETIWIVPKSRSGIAFSRVSRIQSCAWSKYTYESLVSLPVTKDVVEMQTINLLSGSCFVQQFFHPPNSFQPTTMLKWIMVRVYKISENPLMEFFGCCERAKIPLITTMTSITTERVTCGDKDRWKTRSEKSESHDTGM